MLGLRHLIYMAPLVLAAHAFYRLTLERPGTALACLKLLLIPTAGVAVLVVVFRFVPSLELAFLRTPLAGIFVSPNTLEGLFGIGRNNVLDPAKAGGLFVNANVAATFLGMSAIAAWYLGRAHSLIAFRIVAVVDWTAVLATGSKAGLIFALCVPIALAAAGMIRTRQADPLRLFAAIVGIVVVAIVLSMPFTQTLIDEYRYETLATLGTRDELWQYAVQLIGQHAVTGLGFGGWEKLFEMHAFLTGTGIMPAHNSLLILWLQSGVPGLIGGIGLIVAVYAAAARVLRALGYAEQQLAMAILGAFTWYVGQGMGENFGLVGEAHMTPLLGALLGHVCARYDGTVPEEEYDIEPVRGSLAPPALSAV
jgi:O-antigen ligase